MLLVLSHKSQKTFSGNEEVQIVQIMYSPSDWTVSVGGFKAVAGSNGELAGSLHEVPGLVHDVAV